MKNHLHTALRAVLIFIAFSSSYSTVFAQNWDRIIKAAAADRNDKPTGKRSYSDGYASSVSVSGDYAAIGAMGEDEGRSGGDSLNNAGAVYILHRADGKWKQVNKICPSVRKASVCFGFSVAISGDHLVVGVRFEPNNSPGLPELATAGAAYVFRRDKGGKDNWGQVKRIVPSTPFEDARFGNSVSLSGDYIIIGADSENEHRGAAYLFKRDFGGTDNWGEVKKFVNAGGKKYDGYGASVAVSGDNIVIGTPGYDVKMANNLVQKHAGCAFIFFKFEGGTDNWGQIRKIVSPNPYPEVGFGSRLAMSGNHIVVGQSKRPAGGVHNEGAHIFARSQGGENQWGVMAALKHSAPSADDHFGLAVSISGDYAIVGAMGTEAAYVFKSSQGGPGHWGQVKKITSSYPDPGDIFGAAVAISGDHALVGAEEEWNDELEVNPVWRAGAAYFFQEDSGGNDHWGFVKKSVIEELTPDDHYGYSVAINGHYAVVGSPNEDQDRYGRNTLPDAGAAYILYNNNGKWVQVKKLTPELRGAGDHFGTSVAIDGSYIMVGAPHHDYHTDGNRFLQDAGAAYVFFIDAGESGNWGQVDKLTASNRRAYDLFATSVSLSEGIAVVGAPNTDVSAGDQNYGSAYVFAKELNTHSWNQTKELTAETRFDNASFGYSVAVSGNHMIIGAQKDDHDTAGSYIINSGAAYVFKKDEKYRNNWVLARKVYASVPTYNDGFGRSVSINGDYAIVGAYAESENSQDADYKQYSGSAYIFKKDQGGNGNWGQIKKLTAADRSQEDLFGVSVSIHGDYAIVGAYLEDENATLTDTRSGSGSAYLFHKNMGGQDNWGQEKKITAYDRHAGDQFGHAVAISGLVAMAGSPFDQFDAAEQNQLSGAGSVHIFSTTIYTPIDLPVKLSSFTTDKVNSQARISWEVTSEKGLDYYQVQKRTGSQEWTAIGELTASLQTQDTGVYSIMDLKPDEGQNFYRLKMVHADGSIAYGKVGSLAFEESVKLEVYPNPATDRIYIKAHTSGIANSAQILNSMGKIVISETGITQQGIVISQLPAGIYLVKITMNGGAIQTSKILVAR